MCRSTVEVQAAIELLGKLRKVKAQIEAAVEIWKVWNATFPGLDL